MSKVEDYGYVDIKVARENYSEYSLEDGTIMRVRAILLKVVKEGLDLKLNEKTIAVSFSPPSMKGTPSASKMLINEIAESIKKPNLNYTAIKEEWNEYKLKTGEKISMKAILVSASLTDIYDENSDPIYAVQIQTIHRITKK
jgi:hypothetical protein